MIFGRILAYFIASLLYNTIQASDVQINPAVSESSDGDVSVKNSYLNPVLSMSPLLPWSSHFSPSLLSAFPEDLEVSDYCRELLTIFAQRYVLYVNCLVTYARPVKICQNCYIQFGNLKEIYRNISSDQVGPANVSCRDSLLRSDRLMLVFLLYDNLLEIWGWSDCKHCLAVDQHSLTNDTLYYMAILNESLSCFEKHQQGNHSELCKECKPTYKHLNDLYSRMDVNKTLCIDIEDAMNMTRRLWSKNFNCSFPREETVPVIAVSSFMLFLPIIFYLSSFLHSEQKKRKLIHPKRAKSSNSVANIQDKYS
ncbi:osteopetrosis-associated transmembrane protein 1 isoform X2 [Conger conger]|uniref:osteopetrosis-associated transmembrane protein 1 isoform X2 n=1 Tax=Conger conger TaxID=82655 RepID=UPI002A5A2ACC|nr:osteopetrosis-associated transmembrane protein 1 isoform X2 [Conger conger]